MAKFTITAAAEESAERSFAKSDALVAGASKLLNEWINGTSWGPEIVIDVAIELLEQARLERTLGHQKYDAARPKPSNVKPKSRKRFAGRKQKEPAN